jgi:hypothetical protein
MAVLTVECCLSGGLTVCTSLQTVSELVHKLQNGSWQQSQLLKLINSELKKLTQVQVSYMKDGGCEPFFE